MSSTGPGTGTNVAITLLALLIASPLATTLEAVLGSVELLPAEPITTSGVAVVLAYATVWVACFVLYEFLLAPGQLLANPSPDGLPLPLNVILFVWILAVAVLLLELLNVAVLAPLGVPVWGRALVFVSVGLALLLPVLLLYNRLFIGEEKAKPVERPPAGGLSYGGNLLVMVGLLVTVFVGTAVVGNLVVEPLGLGSIGWFGALFVVATASTVGTLMLYARLFLDDRHDRRASPL